MMKKRLFAGILSALMLFSMPNMVCAAESGGFIIEESTAESTEEAVTESITDNEAGDTELPPLTYHGEEELKIDSIQEMQSNRDFAVTLPASYQSPYITSIKNQNPYGTCWAHAAISASEADIVKKGLATTALDLSEWQLAYFCYHVVEDPLGGTAGDSISIVSTTSNYLNQGGTQQVATFRLATWQGLTLESEAPYSTVVSDSTQTLDDALAYGKDSYHLENAYWVSMQDRDIVKQLIMEYGACAASYRHDSKYYNTTNQYGCSEPLAEYNSDNETTNHAITIIGWDDNYSKDNFGTYKPDSDGAWLCKNSWGSYWSKDGLFYISYEDVANSAGNAYFYDYGEADNYDYNYQYDGSAGLSYYSYPRSANIYTAKTDETLKAVGFYTYVPLTNCTVEIYKGCTENPTDGTLVSTKTVYESYAGFHTVKLDTTVDLEAGDIYSVLVYQVSESGTIKAPVDATFNWGWLTGTSSAQQGQSYVANARGSYWIDVSAEGYNCRIKAYTDKQEVKITEITLSQTHLDMIKGATQQLTATVLPTDAANKSVEWTTSNGSVAAVDSNGMVTAVAAGTATITCTASDGSGVKATCKVTVTNPPVNLVTKLTLNKTSASVLKGKTLQLTATVTPSDAENKEVTWKSSNSNIATVSTSGKVTAKAAGTATITCTAKDGSGVKATCKITVKNPVTKVKLNQTQASLSPKETLQLKATVTPSNASNKTVTWKSSNTKVATVSSSGKVTAKSAGTATITCTAKDGSGKKATCKITVYTNTEAFVARIYTKALSRTAEEAGLKYWTEEINSGRKTPVEVAESFFFAPEFTNKNLSDAEYVKVLYRTFMGREYDQGGLDYWLARLKKGESRKSVLESFAGCQEFKDIVKSFGL